jgi:hypothetical protein
MAVYAQLKTGRVVELDESMGATAKAVAMTVAASMTDGVMLGTANFLDDVEVALADGSKITWGDIRRIANRS